MKIVLELSPKEREYLFKALLWPNGLIDEPGYNELVKRVSELPCGSPGCSICDPQPDVDLDWNE